MPMKISLLALQFEIFVDLLVVCIRHYMPVMPLHSSKTQKQRILIEPKTVYELLYLSKTDRNLNLGTLPDARENKSLP